MEEVRIRNLAELRGVLAAAPVFSHMSRGERFFIFPIETRRLSGAVDRINVVARQSLLDAVPIGETGCLHITGELRSFNNKRGEGAKLVITVFARTIAFDEGEDLNRVTLLGTLCKPPNLRVTPMGRDICDLMLAVSRKYGRADYLPVIAWGQLALRPAKLQVGDPLALEGRIQSRPYQKLTDAGPETRIAYEVSMMHLLELPPENL